MQVKEHKPGTFCWIELGTTDADSAKRFYVQLFGWTPVDVPIGPEAVYTMLQRNGQDVAALYQLGRAQRAVGVPAHWLSYVAVDNVDEAAAKARKLGAKLRSDPFDVMEAGRMAVLLDPQGSALALWQAGKHAGSGLVNETGSVGWTELWTSDPEAGATFYDALFGWRHESQSMGSTPYTVFSCGDVRAAGMTELSPDAAQAPRWLPYFVVDRCDEIAGAARDAGGAVVVPPTDVPSVGRFAVLSDKEGAEFGIIQLAS